MMTNVRATAGQMDAVVSLMNRWNSLDQETVDVGSINSFKGRLDKIRKTRMGF